MATEIFEMEALGGPRPAASAQGDPKGGCEGGSDGASGDALGGPPRRPADRVTAVASPAFSPAFRTAVDTDSPLDGAVAGQVDLMAYPFFSLSKTAAMRAIKFVEGAVSLEVRPSDKGVATIYDKEILIYLASLAIERLDRGETFDGVLTFTAYDFFKLAGLSGASGKNYQRLAGSLDRLQGTQVRTTIETGGVNIDGWFSWVSEAQVIFTRDANGQKRARAFRVRITDWLVRAIAADGSVLSYDRAYFALTAIERRVYEIARAGCTGGRPMTLGLNTLRQRVGVTSPLKKFRQLLAQIAERDDLPGYRVVFEESDLRIPLGRLKVTLSLRDTALPPPTTRVAASVSAQGTLALD